MDLVGKSTSKKGAPILVYIVITMIIMIDVEKMGLALSLVLVDMETDVCTVYTLILLGSRKNDVTGLHLSKKMM